MIKRKKATLNTPWDPEEFEVKEVKGAKSIQDQRGEIKRRSKNNVKVLKTKTEQTRYRINDKQEQEMDLEVSWNAITGNTTIRERDEVQAETITTQEYEDINTDRDRNSESGEKHRLTVHHYLG